MFVLYGPLNKGKKASTPSISRWVKQAISQAYASLSSDPPLVIQGRSTRAVAASWAELGGVLLTGDMQGCDLVFSFDLC